MIPLEHHLHNSFQTQDLTLSSSKLILMKTFCSHEYIFVIFFHCNACEIVCDCSCVINELVKVVLNRLYRSVEVTSIGNSIYCDSNDEILMYFLIFHINFRRYLWCYSTAWALFLCFKKVRKIWDRGVHDFH